MSWEELQRYSGAARAPIGLDEYWDPALAELAELAPQLRIDELDLG